MTNKESKEEDQTGKVKVKTERKINKQARKSTEKKKLNEGKYK